MSTGVTKTSKINDCFAWAQELGVFAGEYNHKDLLTNINNYTALMLTRTNEMFEYQDMPATMPPSVFELYLQTYGTVVICKPDDFGATVLRNNEMDIPVRRRTSSDGDELSFVSPGTIDKSAPDLYCFRAFPGGERDIYYRPTIAVIANQALSKSLNLKIGEECVLAKSDTLGQGLLPLFKRSATMQAHMDISFIMAMVNSRIQSIISAAKGTEFESAQKYIEGIYRGDFSTIAIRPFLDGLKLTEVPAGAANMITSLLELRQGLKVEWYNELGIDPNMSQKRQYVSAEEIATSTDNLMPLADDMLKFRILALDAMNDMYGTHASVKKASSWERKELEVVSQAMDGSPANIGGDGSVVDERGSVNSDSGGSGVDSSSSNAE